MKIHSKYNYNNYYLVNNFRRNSGIVVEVNKKNRNLLTQEEYFNIENKYPVGKHLYKTIFERELYYSISSINSMIDNIFGIGTKKMCKILNNCSRYHPDAKILKLLYQFEKLKLDGFRYYYSIYKKEIIFNNLLTELNKFDDIKIQFNMVNGISSNIEYLIDYKGYLFSYYMRHKKNLIGDSEIGKQIYKDKITSISKIFDLIYNRFGKYMK
jgi:hypothetical protein